MSFSDYRKIIVHCGLHKTGTSYLQSILNANAAVLEKRGIEYPPFHRNRRPEVRQGNHSIIAMNYEKHRDVDAVFERFLDIGYRCPTLLISGEGFSKFLPRNGFLEAFMDAASGADVHFIFYLRRPDHMRESVYSQTVKSLVHGDITNTNFQFDFYERIRPFMEAVGKDNITIRPYNKKLWPGGELGADFCAAIGEPKLWKRIAPPSEKLVNASLNRSQMFLLSQLESRPAKQKLVEYFAESREPLPDDGVKFFMSPGERREFNSMHAGAYRRLAKEFGLGDMNWFLGIGEAEEDPDWRPYRPDWEQLFRYMMRFENHDRATQA